MESPDFQAEPFTEREAFAWSIEQAAFAPHVQWFNGLEIPVGRGEFATSSRKLAKAFQWGDKRTRLFLARMERRGKWALRPAQEGAHLATILRVCNYDRFQTLAKPGGAAEDADEGAARAQSGRSEGAQQNEWINNGNEGKAKESASRALVPAVPYSDAVDAWTQVAGALGWKPLKPQLNDQRRKLLGKILKTHGLDGWRGALARAASSELLAGPDPPAWFNFTFVIKPENFLKIQEGNYDRSFNSTSAKQSPWLSAHANLLGSAGGRG